MDNIDIDLADQKAFFMRQAIFLSAIFALLFVFFSVNRPLASDEQINLNYAPLEDSKHEQEEVMKNDLPQEIDNEPESASPDQAVYKGVVNHLLTSGGNGKPPVSLYYPEFGNHDIDADIFAFVDKQAKDYEAEVNEPVEEDERPQSYDMWEMTGFFTLSRPNPDVVSITFNIYGYTGGAHGNLLIQCLNYDLRSSKALKLDDLVQDTEQALKIFSEISSTTLRKELGDDAEDEMIASGTSPNLGNFSNLTLVPDGLFIEFQPYQVGPWSIGPQRTKITLEEMAPAKPNPAIWPSL